MLEEQQLFYTYLDLWYFR